MLYPIKTLNPGIFRFILFCSFSMLIVSRTFAQQGRLKGALSENKIITSTILGYDLQYRVYQPPGYSELSELPVLFLTDGQWYLRGGTMHLILDQLIVSGKVKPIVAVFVDNRDPHDLNNNRRNFQLLGYDSYVDFYREELVPHIENNYKVSAEQSNRGIMGLSFGGLNAAYFGAKASDTFHYVGMQSPALHPVPEIYDLYTKQEVLPIKVFLSTGSKNDTEQHARRMKRTLDYKGYDFKYIEVEQGHNWRNWRPLLDDVLIYFFGEKEQ